MGAPERPRFSLPMAAQAGRIASIGLVFAAACQRTPPKSEDSPEPVAAPAVSTAVAPSAPAS